MLSDEEKKAIEGLEWSQQQMRLGNLPEYNQGHYADIRIVLNLIEKQQKEIEELKEIYQTGYINGCVSKVYEINKKWKDKIKAKIEEYEEKEKYELDAFLCKRALQSLLEEKE